MVSLAAVLVFATDARAALCGKCKNMMYIASIGRCTKCPGHTSSGAFKLCKKCSGKLGQCQNCLAAEGKSAVKPPVKSPVLSAKAAKLATLFKGSAENFTLNIRYYGEQDKPYYQLTIRVPGVRDRRKPFWPAAQASQTGAKKIIDHLAADGFFDRAMDVTRIRMENPTGPAYTFWLSGPKGIQLYEHIGWKMPMLKHLDALAKILDGDASKKMVLLLGRLSGHRKAWARTVPAGGKAINLKSSDNGRTVEAAVGDLVLIKLRGNRSTGFLWSAASQAKDSTVALKSHRYLTDSQMFPEMPPMPGQGGAATFTYRVVRGGQGDSFAGLPSARREEGQARQGLHCGDTRDRRDQPRRYREDQLQSEARPRQDKSGRGFNPQHRDG
jgi:predicted secreted protein